MNKYMEFPKHDDNYDFREGGSHLESWELVCKLYFTEINSYPS